MYSLPVPLGRSNLVPYFFLLALVFVLASWTNTPTPRRTVVLVPVEEVDGCPAVGLLEDDMGANPPSFCHASSTECMTPIETPEDEVGSAGMDDINFDPPCADEPAPCNFSNFEVTIARNNCAGCCTGDITMSANGGEVNWVSGSGDETLALGEDVIAVILCHNDNRYCDEEDSELEATIYANCGSTLVKRWKAWTFCANCGYELPEPE